MEEVRQIADRVTIFRNGRTVSTYDTAQIDDETIIADMLGRRMDRLYPERVGATTPNVALSVRELVLDHHLHDLNLDLHEGEILGIAGLHGHGQRELFHSLFGISQAHGKIKLWDGQSC